jgi:urease accessory protein
VHTDVLIVGQPGRRPRIECSGGLAARETEPDTVYLVSAAATPLGGDTMTVRVVVEEGAVLRLRSAAATLTLPGVTTVESHALWDLEVAGVLDVDPQPTVVAAASRHVTRTSVKLSGSGRLRLRERVQIGRSGESQGFWSGSLHADVDGAPLLRHRVDLGQGSVADDELGAPLACISEMHYPDDDVETAGVTLALAGGGCVSTWQGARL